jgi:hypothetical protein
VKRIHRLILAGACSLALGIGLAACGGSSDEGSSTPTSGKANSAQGDVTATTGGDTGGSSGGYGY